MRSAITRAALAVVLVLSGVFAAGAAAQEAELKNGVSYELRLKDGRALRGRKTGLAGGKHAFTTEDGKRLLISADEIEQFQEIVAPAPEAKDEKPAAGPETAAPEKATPLPSLPRIEIPDVKLPDIEVSEAETRSAFEGLCDGALAPVKGVAWLFGMAELKARKVTGGWYWGGLGVGLACFTALSMFVWKRAVQYLHDAQLREGHAKRGRWVPTIAAAVAASVGAGFVWVVGSRVESVRAYVPGALVVGLVAVGVTAAVNAMLVGAGGLLKASQWLSDSKWRQKIPVIDRLDPCVDCEGKGQLVYGRDERVVLVPCAKCEGRGNIPVIQFSRYALPMNGTVRALFESASTLGVIVAAVVAGAVFLGAGAEAFLNPQWSALGVLALAGAYSWVAVTALHRMLAAADLLVANALYSRAKDFPVVVGRTALLLAAVVWDWLTVGAIWSCLGLSEVIGQLKAGT